jgi:hypothetical protein
MSASQFTSKNESDINVLSADELKLVCRAFAAMNPQSLFETNLKLIEDEPQSILIIQAPEEKKQKQSLLSYFQTLASLLERNEDP